LHTLTKWLPARSTHTSQRGGEPWLHQRNRAHHCRLSRTRKSRMDGHGRYSSKYSGEYSSKGGQQRIKKRWLSSTRGLKGRSGYTGADSSIDSRIINRFTP